MTEGFEIPPDAVTLADYARHAALRLPQAIAGYIDGAGADGHSHAANGRAWSEIRLKGRVLADMRGASTEVTLFGVRLAHPVLLAPVGYHRLAHPKGEFESALGAAASDTVMAVSTLASSDLEALAAEAQGQLWFQLYFQAERADTLRLVRRAEAAGYGAIIATVDAPVKLRNTEERIGFRLPAEVEAVNTRGFAQAPFQPVPGRSPAFLGLLDAAPRWEDIAWLRSQTSLPLLLKGVICPEDAALALEHGVDGIIVSNHGGRALDTLPATAEALPLIARAVGGRVPLIVDGGIRRGTDVLKALALGATAVMIGRPQLHALAVGGARGVAHMLSLLRAEIEVAMALTGCRRVEDIDQNVLWNLRDLSGRESN